MKTISYLFLLLSRKEGEDMDLITYVTDRKGHDMRYAIDSRKLQKELGWEPSLQFEEGIEETVKWYLFSKNTPSLFFDKASCTRQFESELSLHSLASLFPLKEGSTSHLGLLPSGKKRETALLGARNRYALRLADHQRSSPGLCGLGPPGNEWSIKGLAMLCGMGPHGDSSL